MFESSANLVHSEILTLVLNREDITQNQPPCLLIISTTKMPRKELSPQMRSRICELKSIGWSHAKIKAMHPDIPLGTIKTTIRRERTRVDNISKPRSGRPHQLTEEQRDHIHDLSQSRPHIKIKDLLAKVDQTVKKRSLQGLLREMGCGKWRQLKRPEIKPEHAVQRLAWAHRYEHFGPAEWGRVRWSDKCTVERDAGI
jgi:transposase